MYLWSMKKGGCGLSSLVYLSSFVCSEVNSGFFYKSAEEREKLVSAERKFTDDKVRQVITLKKQVNKNNPSFISQLLY